MAKSIWSIPNRRELKQMLKEIYDREMRSCAPMDRGGLIQWVQDSQRIDRQEFLRDCLGCSHGIFSGEDVNRAGDCHRGCTPAPSRQVEQQAVYAQ